MKINDFDLNQLQGICSDIANKTPCHVSIMDEQGIIISSSLKQHIGLLHKGAIKIVSGELDFLEVTAAMAQSSEPIFEGCNLPLTYNDERIASIGVAAPLEKARDFAAIAQTCIQSMLGRVRSQKQQQETEQRFRDFSDIAADWFWEIGPDFRFTYLSGHVENVMGLHPDQILGKTRSEIYGKMDIFESKEWLQYIQCIENKKPFYNFDVPWQRPDGTDCVISLSGKPYFDEKGAFLGYRGVGRDITERERLKFLRQRKNDVLELLTKGKPLTEVLTLLISSGEEMNSGMFGSILLMDKTGKRLLHGAAPSLPGFYTEAVDGIKIGPKVGSCGTAAFTRERIIVEDIENHPFWAGFTKHTQKAGLKACWSQPIFSSTDEVLGTFAMYYKEIRKPNQSEMDFIQNTANLAGIAIEQRNSQEDLARHREHLQDLVYEKTIELNDAIKVAEDANRAKSEFLSGMSHELRTPLNSILGFAQILETDRKDPLIERQVNYVQQIRKGGEHLLELINEILDLSRIEAGKITLSIEPVNTNNLIEDCFIFSNILASKQSITLENHCEDRLASISADPLRAKQALLNLLSNAIKYNTPNGHTWIKAEQFNNTILRISIHDTGPGIAVEKQPDLFVPFQRLGAETTEIEGTGIGLSLTKRILEEMDASIGFESCLGKGSHFWIDFPLAENQIKNTENTLLYLDSSASNIALMNGVLEHIPNWIMLSAETARHGLVIAEEQKPTLIILDAELSDMNNLEVIQRLKMSNKTKDIPLLALNETEVSDIASTKMSTGIQSNLTKPINIPQLSNALEKALEEKR